METLESVSPVQVHAVKAPRKPSDSPQPNEVRNKLVIEVAEIKPGAKTTANIVSGFIRRPRL